MSLRDTRIIRSAQVSSQAHKFTEKAIDRLLEDTMKTFNEFVELKENDYINQHSNQMLPDGTIQLIARSSNIFDMIQNAESVLHSNKNAKGVRFDFQGRKMLVTNENVNTFFDVMLNHFTDRNNTPFSGSPKITPGIDREADRVAGKV